MTNVRHEALEIPLAQPDQWSELDPTKRVRVLIRPQQPVRDTPMHPTERQQQSLQHFRGQVDSVVEFLIAHPELFSGEVLDTGTCYEAMGIVALHLLPAEARRLQQWTVARERTLETSLLEFGMKPTSLRNR